MPGKYPKEDLDLILRHTTNIWQRYANARFFLTGGTGFVGNWIIQAIQHANDTLGCGIEILALSRSPDKARKFNPMVYDRPDIFLLAGDVCNFSANVGTLDLCIHAATEVGDPHHPIDALRVHNTIVQGTRQVLDFCRDHGVSRFLLTSSGAVYGQQPTDISRLSESYRGAPDSLSPAAAYGNGKRTAEWLTASYAKETGFDACIARIFALLGPGLPLDGNFAAGNFVRDVVQGQTIRIQGDGTPLRSYLYMADLVIWLLRILTDGHPGQAYNVGSETEVSIESLARQIQKAGDGQASVAVLMPVSDNQAPARYLPDTTKVQTELGLAEYTPLEVALDKTIRWARTTLTP